MAGAFKQSRLPREDTRTRRNAQRFSSPDVNVADTSAGLSLDPATGALKLDLATDPGLEFNSGDLRVKVASPIKRDSNGVGLTLATDPGLELSSGALQAKVDNPVKRDASGIGLNIGTGLELSGSDLALKTAASAEIGGVLEAAARADSGQTTVTLTATTDPADTPADADALRDDLVANVLPGYATRDTELETAVETLATEFNDLLSKLRSAGVLAT